MGVGVSLVSIQHENNGYRKSTFIDGKYTVKWTTVKMRVGWMDSSMLNTMYVLL